MIKNKITKLLVSAGLMTFLIGAAPAMISNAETISNANVNNNLVGMKVVVKHEINKATPEYDMAKILSAKGDLLTIKTQQGNEVTVNKSDLTVVKNGQDLNIDKMNENMKVIHVTTGLFVRENPSAQAKVVKTLQEGDSVHVIGKVGQWYKIDMNGQVAYAYSSFIGNETVNKAEPKKEATVKKVEAKKVEAKKVEAKKVDVKKAETVKVEAKKTVDTKKVEAKKTVEAKKVDVAKKDVEAKKVEAKKVVKIEMPKVTEGTAMVTYQNSTNNLVGNVQNLKGQLGSKVNFNEVIPNGYELSDVTVNGVKVLNVNTIKYTKETQNIVIHIKKSNALVKVTYKDGDKTISQSVYPMKVSSELDKIQIPSKYTVNNITVNGKSIGNFLMGKVTEGLNQVVVNVNSATAQA